jgi:hypothetical protein
MFCKWLSILESIKWRKTADNSNDLCSWVGRISLISFNDLDVVMSVYLRKNSERTFATGKNGKVLLLWAFWILLPREEGLYCFFWEHRSYLRGSRVADWGISAQRPHATYLWGPQTTFQSQTGGLQFFNTGSLCAVSHQIIQSFQQPCEVSLWGSGVKWLDGDNTRCVWWTWVQYQCHGFCLSTDTFRNEWMNKQNGPAPSPASNHRALQHPLSLFFHTEWQAVKRQEQDIENFLSCRPHSWKGTGGEVRPAGDVH